MLIFGNVDAVDALGSIVEALAFIGVVFPFPHPEVTVLRGEAEARPLPVFPLTFVISVEGVDVVAIAVGDELVVHLSVVDAGGVATDGRDERVVVPLPVDGASLGISHNAMSLPHAVVPHAAVEDAVAFIQHAEAFPSAIQQLSAVDGAVLSFCRRYFIRADGAGIEKHHRQKARHEKAYSDFSPFLFG